MGEFKGFPNEGIALLKKMKKNNDRVWFRPRKDEYIELLQKPMAALIRDIAKEMRASAPEVRFTDKAILRVYRDTRFSKDKTPLKTFVAASFGMGTAKKSVDTTGFYVQLEPGEVFVGGGLYMPDSKQLGRIRYALDQHPDEFLDLVEGKSFKKTFGGIQGEKLKRNPQGYLPDHPMIDYLKFKQFYVSRTFDEKAAYSSQLVGKVVETYERILPLARWLRKSSTSLI